MDRVVVAHSPLSESLLFKSMVGHEALSCIYQYDVEFLCKDNSLSLSDLLGKPLTLELNPRPGVTRYLSGIITRMAFLGHEKHREEYYTFRAEVRPELWYLTQNSGFRIWQKQTVKQIIETVLNDAGIIFENKLTGTYREWEFCVQYQESTYAFLQRLMEHEGIYFYFEHALDKQTLILVDDPAIHTPFPGYDCIEYHQAAAGGYVNDESINIWQATAAISPSLYQHDDYNYLESNADLSANGQISQSHAQKVATQREWPGQYPQQGDGQNYVNVRQQELAARQLESDGVGDAFGLAPGYTFALTKAPRASDEGQSFLVTAVDYQLVENSYASNDEDFTRHCFQFRVVPATVNWRPARNTPWPRTSGPQTAVVVNAPDATKGDNSTVATDDYGRVRVKFLWFKAENEQDLYSCWLRVASGWAGSQQGYYQIPRVGEEVVVDFINGDPHMPVITGRVYNNLQTQPVGESLLTISSEGDIGDSDTITAEAAESWSWSKSGFWSRSIGNSDASNGNFISFDDLSGDESLDIHAQKDLNLSADNAIKIYAGKAGDGAMKMWSEGKFNIHSNEKLTMTAPNTTHSVRGTYYTVTGSNFTANAIGLTVNGVNGTVNVVSNVAASGTDFAFKGISMDYTYLKRSKTQVEYKADLQRFEQVPFYQIRVGLMSLQSGATGVLGDNSAIKTKIQNLKDKMEARKEIKEEADAKKYEEYNEKQGEKITAKQNARNGVEDANSSGRNSAENNSRRNSTDSNASNNSRNSTESNASNNSRNSTESNASNNSRNSTESNVSNNSRNSTESNASNNSRNSTESNNSNASNNSAENNANDNFDDNNDPAFNPWA
ncbi:type VI secretion system Vgr family protein [Candidatus Pantoea formicae]|uniref:type VI secretion system Vgr family protein n=1 Tax=Candidatus Pantoea formicae TaxID=2608355 RepID=UPI003EDB468F